MVSITKHFSNLTDFANEAERAAPNNWRGGDDSRELTRPWFYGTPDFNSAMTIARHGWLEGRELMFKELGEINALASGGSYPIWEHDVAGFLPDVPRAVAGLPDCMFNAGEYTHRARPVIRLCVNLGRRADIESESINWHGAAILSWVDRLEQLNMAVEITAVMASETSKDVNYIWVELKQAGEVLDLDRMAFALAQPSFHRRLKWGVMENIPELKRMRAGYGASIDIPESMVDGYQVYIARIRDNYSTRAEALKTISSQFKRQLTTAGINLPESEAA